MTFILGVTRLQRLGRCKGGNRSSTPRSHKRFEERVNSTVLSSTPLPTACACLNSHMLITHMNNENERKLLWKKFREWPKSKVAAHFSPVIKADPQPSTGSCHRQLRGTFWCPKYSTEESYHCKWGHIRTSKVSMSHLYQDSCASQTLCSLQLGRFV